jgi:hypothetical protein
VFEVEGKGFRIEDFRFRGEGGSDIAAARCTVPAAIAHTVQMSCAPRV